MVGRELPNMCPNGEDHRGAGGGVGRLKRGYTNIGLPEKGLWRSWTAKIRIHKALIWQDLVIDDLLVTRFNLQVQSYVATGDKGEHMHMRRRASLQRKIQRQAPGKTPRMNRIRLPGNWKTL